MKEADLAGAVDVFDVFRFERIMSDEIGGEDQAQWVAVAKELDPPVEIGNLPDTWPSIKSYIDIIKRLRSEHVPVYAGELETLPVRYWCAQAGVPFLILQERDHGRGLLSLSSITLDELLSFVRALRWGGPILSLKYSNMAGAWQGSMAFYVGHYDRMILKDAFLDPMSVPYVEPVEEPMADILEMPPYEPFASRAGGAAVAPDKYTGTSSSSLRSSDPTTDPQRPPLPSSTQTAQYPLKSAPSTTIGAAPAKPSQPPFVKPPFHPTSISAPSATNSAKLHLPSEPPLSPMSTLPSRLQGRVLQSVPKFPFREDGLYRSWVDIVFGEFASQAVDRGPAKDPVLKDPEVRKLVTDMKAQFDAVMAKICVLLGGKKPPREAWCQAFRAKLQKLWIKEYPLEPFPLDMLDSVVRLFLDEAYIRHDGSPGFGPVIAQFIANPNQSFQHSEELAGVIEELEVRFADENSQEPIEGVHAFLTRLFRYMPNGRLVLAFSKLLIESNRHLWNAPAFRHFLENSFYPFKRGNGLSREDLISSFLYYMNLEDRSASVPDGSSSDDEDETSKKKPKVKTQLTYYSGMTVGAGVLHIQAARSVFTHAKSAPRSFLYLPFLPGCKDKLFIITKVPNQACEVWLRHDYTICHPDAHDASSGLPSDTRAEPVTNPRPSVAYLKDLLLLGSVQWAGTNDDDPGVLDQIYPAIRGDIYIACLSEDNQVTRCENILLWRHRECPVTAESVRDYLKIGEAPDGSGKSRLAGCNAREIEWRLLMKYAEVKRDSEGKIYYICFQPKDSAPDSRLGRIQNMLLLSELSSEERAEIIQRLKPSSESDNKPQRRKMGGVPRVGKTGKSSKTRAAKQDTQSSAANDREPQYDDHGNGFDELEKEVENLTSNHDDQDALLIDPGCQQPQVKPKRKIATKAKPSYHSKPLNEVSEYPKRSEQAGVPLHGDGDLCEARLLEECLDLLEEEVSRRHEKGPAKQSAGVYGRQADLQEKEVRKAMSPSQVDKDEACRVPARRAKRTRGLLDVNGDKQPDIKRRRRVGSVDDEYIHYKDVEDEEMDDETGR
jgi:hypothetical protein